MGIGDWGLGIGDWGLGPIPNPQSPIEYKFANILFHSLANSNLTSKLAYLIYIQK
jgi:hypothetical protein